MKAKDVLSCWGEGGKAGHSRPFDWLVVRRGQQLGVWLRLLWMDRKVRRRLPLSQGVLTQTEKATKSLLLCVLSASHLATSQLFTVMSRKQFRVTDASHCVVEVVIASRQQVTVVMSMR